MQPRLSLRLQLPRLTLVAPVLVQQTTQHTPPVAWVGYGLGIVSRLARMLVSCRTTVLNRVVTLPVAVQLLPAITPATQPSVVDGNSIVTLTPNLLGLCKVTALLRVALKS